MKYKVKVTLNKNTPYETVYEKYINFDETLPNIIKNYNDFAVLNGGTTLFSRVQRYYNNEDEEILLSGDGNLKSIKFYTSGSWLSIYKNFSELKQMFSDLTDFQLLCCSGYNSLCCEKVTDYGAKIEFFDVKFGSRNLIKFNTSEIEYTVDIEKICELTKETIQDFIPNINDSWINVDGDQIVERTMQDIKMWVNSYSNLIYRNGKIYTYAIAKYTPYKIFIAADPYASVPSGYNIYAKCGEYSFQGLPFNKNEIHIDGYSYQTSTFASSINHYKFIICEIDPINKTYNIGASELLGMPSTATFAPEEHILRKIEYPFNVILDDPNDEDLIKARLETYSKSSYNNPPTGRYYYNFFAANQLDAQSRAPLGYSYANDEKVLLSLGATTETPQIYYNFDFSVFDNGIPSQITVNQGEIIIDNDNGFPNYVNTDGTIILNGLSGVLYGTVEFDEAIEFTSSDTVNVEIIEET